MTTRPDDRGIGGTGVVGVITGFGSICVDGLEVALDPAADVSVDGEPATASALRIGQLVALQATDAAVAPHADWLAVRHEVVGEVQTASEGVLVVAGQRVLTGAQTRGIVHPVTGSRVAVSGLRDASGAVAATRVDADATTPASAQTGASGVAANAPVLVHGRLTHDGARLRIGALLVSPAAGLRVPDDGPVTATGVLHGPVLRADTLTPDLLATDPATYFGPSVDRYVIESYVDAATGRLVLGQAFRGGGDGQAGRSVMAFERTVSSIVIVSSRSPDAAAAALEVRGHPTGDAGLFPSRTGGSAARGMDGGAPEHGPGGPSFVQPGPGAVPSGDVFTPAPMPLSGGGFGQNGFGRPSDAAPPGAGPGRSGPFTPGPGGGPYGPNGAPGGPGGGSAGPGPHR